MPNKTKKQQIEVAETAPTPSPNGANGSKPDDQQILTLLATGMKKAAVAKQLGVTGYQVNAAVERSLYNGKLKPRAKPAAPASE